MRSATIDDIAREAGVGKSTVSRVISGNGYVSDKTRAKITKVMEAMNYQPSAAARNLSRQESDIIGLILPEVNNQFFSDILKGVSQMVDKWGYTLMLSSSENDPERDFRALRAMISQRVCGLAYIPAIDYNDDPWYSRLDQLLKQLGCPVVILDRPLERFEFDTVMTDNYSGAYAATEALIQAGHRRIGIVAGDMQLFIGRERFEGFRDALRQNGLRLNEEDVIDGRFDEQITYEKTLQMFKRGRCPTGFLVCNNLSTFGFLKAVEEMKLRIPEDVAFVSFDKLVGQDIYNIPYTHLDRHVLTQGLQAMQVLLRRIHTPDRPVEKIVNLPEVVLRGSEKLVK